MRRYRNRTEVRKRVSNNSTGGIMCMKEGIGKEMMQGGKMYSEFAHRSGRSYRRTKDG